MTPIESAGRWLAVPLAGTVAFLGTVCVVYWPLHAGLLLACPSPVTLGTTDLSKPDYSAYVSDCLAPWYRFAEGGAYLAAILAAVLACGLVAFKVAPTRKRTASMACALVAIAATAVGFYVNR